jgi:hypothetical protein
MEDVNIDYGIEKDSKSINGKKYGHLLGLG